MPERERPHREGIQRAYELLRRRQTAAAIAAVSEERRSNPRSTYLMAVEADILGRAGRTAGAEALLAEIFALDPGNRKALAVKADILLHKGQAAEALATLLTHPDQAAPHVARRLAHAHFQLKQYSEALAVTQRVLADPRGDLSPEEAGWFKGMAARSLEKLGETGRAVEFWQDAGTDEARARVLRLKIAALPRGQALQELERIGRLKGYDRDAEFHALWAEQLAADDRPGEAAAHWRRAAELRPGHAYYVKRLAYELRKAGRTQEALVSFQEAVLADPADLWLREALYRLFSAGREKEGVAFLEELLRRHPEAGWAHGHLKKLAGAAAAKESLPLADS